MNQAPHDNAEALNWVAGTISSQAIEGGFGFAVGADSWDFNITLLKFLPGQLDCPLPRAKNASEA